MIDVAIFALELAAKLFGWATLEVRIALRASKSAKQLGVPVHRKLLRRTISAPAFLQRFESTSTATRRAVDLDLAATFKSPSSDVRDVEVLRTALSRAYLASLKGGGDALQHKESQDEARAQRLESVISAASDDRALFDSRLQKMHPMRAREFRELQIAWDRTPTLVGLLDGDPQAQLAYWASFPPAVLREAPPDVFGTLANVAAGYGLNEVSAAFIERGLELGLSPEPYWRVRLMPLIGVRDRNGAATFLSAHRGYPLAEAHIAESGRAVAREALTGWRPAHVGEEVHRRILLADLYLADLLVDDAISVALEAVRDFDSTDAALIAARAMMARATTGNSQLHQYDISDALVFARKAREDRQRWGVRSGEALALVLRLMRMLSDIRGALKVGSPLPAGTATESELDELAVVRELALLYAAVGDVDRARTLRSKLDPADDEDLAAVMVDEDGSALASNDALHRAIDAADDWGDKADIMLQLAFRGVRADLLDELEQSNPTIAAEVQLVASLFAEEQGALERFRGFAASSFRGTIFLLRYYQEQGDTNSGAVLARDGALAWNDSDLWVESAKYKFDSGDREGAIGDLHSALVAAAPGWGGRRDTYRRLLEAYSGIGRWHDARNAAAQLLAQDPDVPDSAWALIVCQLRTSDATGALYTWRVRGRPHPRSEMQVGAWIELLRHFGDDFATPKDALVIASEWPTHEKIRRGLVVALFTGGARDAREDDDVAGDDVDQTSAGTLMQDYLRDFPNGEIWSVDIDDDDILGSLKSAIGDAAGTTEVDESIFNGSLPVGFGAEVHRRTYLEAVVVRRRGPIHSGSRSPTAEKKSIEAARNGLVVIDTSAMVTRALIPGELGDLIFGQFAGARAVAEQHRDAVDGLASLRSDRGLSVRLGGAGEAASVSTTSPEELAARLAVAERAEGSFRAVVSVSHPDVIAIDALKDQDFRTPLFAALDYSIASGIPLWCDDRVLRSIAEDEGGMAFGTMELLAVMREAGEVASSDLDLAEATLIAAGYTGARFDADVWTLARTISQGHGLQNAVRFANADSVKERVLFALEEVDSQVGNPELLAATTNAACRWILAIAGDDDAAAQNLRLLWRAILGRPWMTSSVLPFCLEGVRPLDRISDPVGVVLAEIHSLFEVLSAGSDERMAALAVFELVSKLSDEDGKRVRSAIVTGRFE